MWAMLPGDQPTTEVIAIDRFGRLVWTHRLNVLGLIVGRIRIRKATKTGYPPVQF